MWASVILSDTNAHAFHEISQISGLPLDFYHWHMGKSRPSFHTSWQLEKFYLWYLHFNNECEYFYLSILFLFCCYLSWCPADITVHFHIRYLPICFVRYSQTRQLVFLIRTRSILLEAQFSYVSSYVPSFQLSSLSSCFPSCFICRRNTHLTRNYMDCSYLSAVYWVLLKTKI